MGFAELVIEIAETVRSAVYRWFAESAPLMRLVKIVSLIAVVIAIVVVIVVVPLPSVDQMRTWAADFGPWFPVTFILGHALITTLPFPRTVFTISAGLLFGPVLGVTAAVGASTISAILAFYAVRAAGWHRVTSQLSHPAVGAIQARLIKRGWLAVGSMRLIPALPFSLINYSCGASSMRVVPYVAATVVGLAPGTIAMVLLADAVTGSSNPALLAVSVVCAGIGLVGLAVDAAAPVEADPADPSGADVDTDKVSA